MKVKPLIVGMLLVFAGGAGITGGVGYAMAIHRVKGTGCTAEIRSSKKVETIHVNCNDLDKLIPANDTR